MWQKKRDLLQFFATVLPIEVMDATEENKPAGYSSSGRVGLFISRVLTVEEIRFIAIYLLYFYSIKYERYSASKYEP